MRFKKLRISIGIAWIIFIFIAGNIIIIGELMKEKYTIRELPYQNIVAAQKNNRSISRDVPTSISVEDEEESTEEDYTDQIDMHTSNNKISRDNKPAVKDIVQSGNIIVHNRRRTRAS